MRTLRCLLSMGVASVVALAGCRSVPPVAESGQAMTRLAPGNYTLDCDQQGNNECWVPLVVTARAPDCKVAWIFQRIEVSRNVKVIWYLNETSGYEFDATSGIDIKNEAGQDPVFDDNSHDNNRKHRFKWKAKAASGGPQQRNYEIKVKATSPNNKPFCDFEDPVIVNRG